MFSITKELDDLRDIAWAQDRVRFTATYDPAKNVIYFSSFGRAGQPCHYNTRAMAASSQKGAGKKVLGELLEIADRHGASVRLFCSVPKLITGLYAEVGFTDDDPGTPGTTRYMTRQPILQPIYGDPPLSARNPCPST